MRKVVGGLIQMSNPLNDAHAPVAKISQAMLEKHLPYIEEAGKQGVQLLCLQEVFNGPYFCPSQDAKWCDIAEPIPGPTIELMQKLAKKHEMVIIVPIYEREMAGVYYNTAAVIDADGSYLGKYRKNHIPHTAGFWEKFFFKPGNLGYPVFKTQYATIGVYICYDRHFPEGARVLGLHGAEIVSSGSSSNRRTRWRTATSWAASTASAPKRRGTSVSSTARAISWTPAATSSRKAVKTKTSSSWPK